MNKYEINILLPYKNTMDIMVNYGIIVAKKYYTESGSYMFINDKDEVIESLPVNYTIIKKIT